MSDQGPAVVDAHYELEPRFADGFWRTAALFGVLGFLLGFLFAWLLFRFCFRLLLWCSFLASCMQP